MDTVLSDAIENGFQVVQIVLPNSSSPRLNMEKLPIADPTQIGFISSLLNYRPKASSLPIYMPTNKHAAALLATPMRNAGIAGPDLRKAHHQAGWFLSCEVLTRIIGMEACPISHVLGHETTGSRLLHEHKTVIVAVMRAGDPMASGVSEAFPRASHMHASGPDDIQTRHLRGQRRVTLVDSVVNTGKTLVGFVQKIRSLEAELSFVVVAGVVQSECIEHTHSTYKTLSNCGNISLVMLRLSTTKFTGSGTTDTGNRLFSTTHLKREN